MRGTAMTTVPTPADLLDIQQRLSAATPGPWVNDGAEIYADIIGGQWIGETLRLDDPTSESDAEFIAHARQDVDDLLAEVKRYRDGTRTAMRWMATEYARCLI